MQVVVVESAVLEDWPSAGVRARAISPALVVSRADGVGYVHALYGRTYTAGSRFVSAHRVLGRTWVLVHTVEQLEGGRSWRTRAAVQGAVVVLRLRLRPPPEPTVSLGVELELSGAARVARPLLSWSVRRSARHAVRRLADELQAAAVMAGHR